MKKSRNPSSEAIENKVMPTPGPWRIDLDEDILELIQGDPQNIDYDLIEELGDEIIIVGPRQKCRRNGEDNVWEMCRIDNACFWDNPKTFAEDWANARQIVAGPDLVAALNQAVATLSLCKNFCPKCSTGKTGKDISDSIVQGIAALQKAGAL